MMPDHSDDSTDATDPTAYADSAVFQSPADADPAADLPLGVVVRVGPHLYAPFVFLEADRLEPQYVPAGHCLAHDNHTTHGGPIKAIIRLGDACYETAPGVGVLFCPACVQTLARACIPLTYNPQPEHRFSLKNALYTIGAVLDPAWEAGIASVCEYRGPAAQECVSVPWATDEATAPPVNVLPAPGDVPGWKPDMYALTTPLNPANYRDRRLWIDHGGMTRPLTSLRVGLVPRCDEQRRIEWIGDPFSPGPVG